MAAYCQAAGIVHLRTRARADQPVAVALARVDDALGAGDESAIDAAYVVLHEIVPERSAEGLLYSRVDAVIVARALRGERERDARRRS